MRMPASTRPLLVCIVIALVAGLPALAQSSTSLQCSKLKQLNLDHARVISARTVAAGKFVAPAGPDGKATQLPSYRTLPAFCRAVIDAAPTSDSDIKIEVWLPVDGWNGRLQGQGNGGFAGTIDYRLMALSVAHGFATTGTDTGHAGDGLDSAWALGHPEKVADFGWRGIHQMTVHAKAVVAAYYGKPAAHNYFAACSDGGREALMEAQRFPEDYDGILAGAPAYAWTELMTSAALGMQALLDKPENYIPPTKVPLITRSIVSACDQQDGLKDGLITDPRQCHFKAATLTCKPGRTERCLTSAQTTTLETLFAEKHVGNVTLPGFLASGGEEDPNGWPSWVTGPARGKSAGVGFASGFFNNMVYGTHDWDFRKFEPVAGLAAARAKTAQSLDATNTDLSAFQKRGGKLILYHGWADAAISPLYSIAYYSGVRSKMGDATAASFTRLYLLPGVKHCAEGPGPDMIGQFGLLSSKATAQDNAFRALENWVEEGMAPDAIIAAKYAKPFDPRTTVMTRPTCSYPQKAHYQGTGDPKSAASFVCR